MMQLFKLIKKVDLTKNVYKMIFECENEIKIIPGQFITFLLNGIGGRAYSILKIEGKNIIFIIKKWEKEEGGKGGSKYICELNIGECLKGVGPAGHFLLKENNKNKMFIGTGTGFVPLYNQILGSIEKKQNCKLKLIFGVREKKDLFYIEQLEELKNENNNFDYEIYLSRENIIGMKKGYVTDYLIENNISLFDEYYICGISGMIDSTIKKILELGINKENIFFEKY